MPTSKVVATARPNKPGATSMSASDSPIPQKASGAVNDRRGERRRRNIPVALDRRGPVGERKAREVGERRRQVDPTTCERDYNEDEIEFMRAMDQYKRDNRRPFPTWSEVLEVLAALGYRRVAEPTALPGNTKPATIPPKG
jgi:hypothetical protein